MDLIAPLPQAPHALLEYHNNSPVLVFADSLAIHKNNELRFIECGPLDGAARGPDGRLYCTQGERILCFDLEQEDQIQDLF